MMNVTNSEKVLKNYCKAKGYERPIYRMTARHSVILEGNILRSKHYQCMVSVNGVQLAKSDGVSKRIARKKAAMCGLQQLRVYELQQFWQAYRQSLGISAQKMLDGGPNGSTMVTASRNLQSIEQTKSMLQIEELLSTGMITPVNSGEVEADDDEHKTAKTAAALTMAAAALVTSHQQSSSSSTSKENEKHQHENLDDDDFGNDNGSSNLLHSKSMDSSDELINAAIEKLKSYTDNVNDDDNGGGSGGSNERDGSTNVNNQSRNGIRSGGDRKANSDENLVHDLIEEVTKDIAELELHNGEDFDLDLN